MSRALDAEVAEKVMGWRWWRTTAPSGRTLRGLIEPDVTPSHKWELADGSEELFSGDNSFMPRYSSDIAAAMEVVEKMRGQGWSFACTMYEGLLPYASFCKRTAASSRNAESESLPEAICRAALQATASAAGSNNEIQSSDVAEESNVSSSVKEMCGD